MKILVGPRSTAATMLVTLLMAIIIGITLASYLSLVSAQNRSVMRSLAWNATIPTLEAGIEEALNHIRYRGITNLSADGWTAAGNVYTKQRALGSGHYDVAISVPRGTQPPEIVSTGYQLAPLSPIAQVGLILGNVAGADVTAPQYIKRRVLVTTVNAATFAYAMLAKDTIDLRGNRISTDSFNSTDPTRSDFSVYGRFGVYDRRKASDNGDVATNSSIKDALNTGNADIKGKVSTGPGGTIAIGPEGSVGDAAWVDGGNTGIQPGAASDDTNIDIPPANLPGLPWAMAYSGNYKIGETNYSYALNGGSHKITSFKGKIHITGEVSVYVPYGGSFDLSGNNYVYLAPGATLKVYVGAAEADISGNGIANVGTALDFQYYGLDTNTKLSFSGNGAFTGTIYAPEADFTLNGGGRDSLVDFIGASVTRTVIMNGKFAFHYDEALETLGPNNGYRMTSWNEIDPDT